MAFNAPHDPFQAPPEYIAQFSHLPYDLETRKQRAMVKALDDAIGQVMDALERRGVLDETLVMFLNDNGGLSEAGGNSPYRGLKGSYLEGGIRVPAVMRWPSRITAGSASDALMHVADLFPTFAGLAGADTGGGLPLDGLDVWEAIANGAESPREEVVHSLDVIRVGDWKLLEEDGEFAKGDKSSPLQLYNIAEDPYETTNLASSETARVAELRERLVYHRPFARDAEPGAPIPGLDSIDSTDDRPVMFGEEENTAFGAAVQTALTQREVGNLGPELLRIETSGDQVKMVYDETLDADSVPPTDAFTVVVNPGYESAEVSGVGVSGREIVLTLAEAVAGGNTMGLTYEVPDTGAIQDADSLEAVGITWVTATVSITDDDLPAVTVSFEQAIYTVPEGGNVTVKVKLSADPERDVTLTITKTNQDETSDSDYSPVPDTIMIADGDTEASFAFSATQDAIDDDGEKVKLDFGDLPTGVTASGTTEATVSITDDDVSPVITTNTASTILVEENETAVATLAATDADRPAEDLTWRITGGADRNGFRLTADGVLTFAAPQDYEAPDDSDGNGDYEVTVEVSDGTNPVEAVFTVRLEDVDDTAPALSSAVVNGATLTLTYGEALDGTSTPAVGDFTVAGGNSARTVSNVGVSGQAVTLTLNPAVEHGETGIRVSYRPGTNPTQDAAGNDALGLSNQPVTNNTGDTAAPTVSAIAITSRPERNATYAAGKEIAVTVTFSETVVVTGTPRLSLNVGGVSRTAACQSGAGAAAVFVYMVADGESDDVGVSVEANSLTLNGERIRDGANNNAVLTHDGLAADAGHKVDGVKPALAANRGAVVNGATLTLTYDEALDGSSTPLALAFTVNVDGAEPRISRVAVSGSAVTLTLDPEVGVGQTARLTYRVPGANPIQDTVGNAARVITNRTVENNTRDTMAPSVSRVAITSDPGPDGIYAEEDVIEVTVTFSETVTVDTTNGTPSLALTVGRPSQPALYSPGSASVAQRFTYTVGDSDIDTDGVSIGAGRIALNGGTIQDLADNPSLLVYEAVPPQPGHAVDGVRPVLQGTTVRGTTLTLTYGEALDGDSTPAADDFTVKVADIERLLTQVLVGGSTVTLTLVSEVTPGEAVTVSYTRGRARSRTRRGTTRRCSPDRP